MPSGRFSRRGMLLAGATAAGAAVVVPAAPALAGDGHGPGDRGSSRLTGTWDVIHADDPPNNPMPVRAVISFTADGIMIIRDLNPPGPPGQGSWTATGRRSLAFIFVEGLQVPPAQGIAVLTVTGAATVDKDAISGTFAFTVADASGAQVGQGTGTLAGHRLVVPAP